jgi:prepilin-type N-terminal cleavage/methylation domain-containing protein
MIKINKEKYEGFSLVEMIITIAIMGVVMIISSTVLSTLIRVSTVSSNKIRARNESEFVLELLRRTIRNSDPSDVYIFKSNDPDALGQVRAYDPENDVMVSEIDEEDIYASGLPEGQVGNEIQFRPYGFSNWLCLGFFHDKDDESKGYILWTSGYDLRDNHASCFASNNSSSYLMLLNSDYINIKDFQISYMKSADGNYIITFDILSEPVNWYLGPNGVIDREVHRKGVVSTEGVVW